VRDELAMQRAMALAETVRRLAPPNPWVGCVLLRDGEMVGEGATAAPGGPHAEITALSQAGTRAHGATAVVTLEPCSHHGRTGPCVDALVAAGVARVVVGIEDPDPQVSGRGVAALRTAGIVVDVGAEAAAVTGHLAPYLHHRSTGRPYVVGKLAMSLDGRVLAGDGSPRWITGNEARADAHDLRAESQAIVIGSGTALADHPSLTVRDARPPQPAQPPWRVLVDRRGRVPAQGPLFDASLAPTLVLTSETAEPSTVDAWLGAGAKVERVPDLATGLEVLGRHGVLQAMVEGGPTLVDALFTAGLVDRFVVYLAPRVLGGEGIPAVSVPATLRTIGARPVGNDVRLDYLPAAEDR